MRGRMKWAGRMEKMASGKLVVKIADTQNTKDTEEWEERSLNGRAAWGGTRNDHDMISVGPGEDRSDC